MKIIYFFKSILLKDSENNIWFTIWGLILLLIICILFLFPSIIFDNTQNSAEILLVNAQILATIFAITASFTILGLQYVSQDLTPRIMNYFIKSREILSFFGFYIFAIISNLFVVSFPKIINPSQFVFISYLTLIFCLFFLIFYLKFVIHGIQPTIIISSIEKNIPANFDETIIEREFLQYPSFLVSDDPFIELEQIIIRSIRKNDYASFSYCLQRIFSLNIRYLEKLLSHETESEYQQLWAKTDALQYYFLGRYNQILFEILNQDNEKFLNDYIKFLVNITEHLFQLKSDLAITEFENHFHYIGKLIIEKRYHRTGSNYLHELSRIIEIEFSHLPSGNMSILFSDPIPDVTKMSEKESCLWYFGNRTFDRFFSELNFLFELANRVQSEEFFIFFFSIEYALEGLLIKAVKITDNDLSRTRLVIQLLSTYLKVHEISLKNKASDSDLLRFLLAAKNYSILSIKEEIIGFYNEMGKLSLRYDDPVGIANIGIASRFLIHQYPEITTQLVDIIIECSKNVSSNKELKKISIQEIKRELNSIKSQNTDKTEEINRKIDEEITRINKILE